MGYLFFMNLHHVWFKRATENYTSLFNSRAARYNGLLSFSNFAETDSELNPPPPPRTPQTPPGAPPLSSHSSSPQQAILSSHCLCTNSCPPPHLLFRTLHPPPPSPPSRSVINHLPPPWPLELFLELLARLVAVQQSQYLVVAGLPQFDSVSRRQRLKRRWTEAVCSSIISVRMFTPVWHSPHLLLRQKEGAVKSLPIGSSQCNSCQLLHNHVLQGVFLLLFPQSRLCCSKAVQQVSNAANKQADVVLQTSVVHQVVTGGRRPGNVKSTCRSFHENPNGEKSVSPGVEPEHS